MTKPATNWTPADGSATLISTDDPEERITEDGQTRVTEAGDTRVLESTTVTPKPKTDWSEHDD